MKAKTIKSKKSRQIKARTKTTRSRTLRRSRYEKPLFVITRGDPISNKIQQAKEVAASLLNGGVASANALLLNASNQLNVAIENLVILLGDQINRTLDQLSEDLRQIVLKFDQTIQTFEKLADQAFQLESVASIDAEQALGQIPFVKERFILKSIKGVTLLRQDNDYVLTIVGTNVGTAPSDTRCNVQLLFSNSTVVARQQKTSQHVLELYIPAAQINGQYSDNSIKMIQTTIKIHYEYKKLFRWHTIDQTFPFFLTLMPLIAGSATLTYRYPTKGWRYTGEVFVDLGPTPDHDQDGNDVHQYAYTTELVVNRDERLVRADWSFQGGEGGRWSRTERPSYTNPSPIDPNSFMRVQGRVWVWGRPTIWRLFAQKETHTFASEATGSSAFTFKYGDVFSIDINSEAKEGVIEGTLNTKQSIKFLLTGSDSTNTLVVANIESLENVKRVWFTVNRPKT